MIDIDLRKMEGIDPAIEWMRNACKSWDRSDSGYFGDDGSAAVYAVGTEDLKLATKLAASGTDHAKYRRQIIVWVGINAPLYWWKEFDTYRVGVEKNSESTMHTIAKKEFTMDDFSHEHLPSATECMMSLVNIDGKAALYSPKGFLALTIKYLNAAREQWLETKDKTYWWTMIQLLPTCYNQYRGVTASYEALANMYHARKDHKLDEWQEFCKWIETLPYSKEFIQTAK